MPTTERELTGHRRRAVKDLSCDLVVTAGAGAGKTTVLVDRFVEIASDPRVGPERILAITFTKKAATEMKERVIRRFEEMGEKALRRATEASYISTIHGFAERILRERPFDARIDPAFTVITEYDRELWIEEALQQMYERTDLGSYAARLKKDFRDGGWRVFSIVREVARLMREGPAAARAEADAIGHDAKAIDMALERARASVRRAELEMLECMRELHPILDGATFKSAGAKHKLWRAYVDAVTGCIAAKGLANAADVWRATSFTSEIPIDERTPIRGLLDRIKDLAPRATFSDWDAQIALERELLPLKRAIYAAAAEIDESYSAHKRSIGALDFHDLQLRAAALLDGNASVRAEYAERFRHILLDESQDTDELQYGIIESLRTPDNTLFMVGDPKQSIYEFRGANPDVFHAAVARLASDSRLSLPENFRSRREIISMINGLGEPLLAEQFVHIDPQADYGPGDLSDPAVTVFYAEQRRLDDGGKKCEPVSDARPREAAAVAEELVRLLREAPLVRDPDSRAVSWVSLRPRHVAILFRTRTAIPYFERALAERGVPYVTAAGQGFYERAEVLDCLMMLRAIAQPLDDLAMAAVLRSPFVGASDGDLWKLRATSSDARPPIWDALRGYAPLARFYLAFRRLRTRARGSSAWEALEDAIRTFDYEAALAAHLDGPAMLANLAKVRRQVRDMGSRSASEAYAELERTRELLTNESTAPLVGPADDVVVLTTIHQAKGLEWPIVCLPNLQAASKGKGDAAFSPRHGTLLLKALDVYGKEVVPFSLQAVLEEMDARAEAEERRLLYVALTRARERLILSACEKEQSEDAKEGWKPGGRKFNPLSFLKANSDVTLSAEGEHDCATYRTRVVRVRGPVLERTMFQGGRPLAATWSPTLGGVPEPRPPRILALPLSLKVTELLAYRRCPQVYRFAHVLEIEENLARRAAVRAGAAHGYQTISPVELGTKVHALLERVRFDAHDTSLETARLVADLPEEIRPAISRMLDAVLQSEIGTAIRAAKRVEREWPFATRVGGVLVEGVIDLAILGPDDRWTVVDYKSNDFSRTGRYEYLIDYYTPQLELYAMALSKAGLGDVAECALVFLTGPRVHRWSFDGAKNGVWSEDAVRRIAARDYSTSAGPKCEMCGYRKRKVCDTGRSWDPAAAPRLSRALPTLPG